MNGLVCPGLSPKQFGHQLSCPLVRPNSIGFLGIIEAVRQTERDEFVGRVVIKTKRVEWPRIKW